MVAIPFCRRCLRKVDPYRERCPKCGSVVRFRFVEEGSEILEEKDEDSGFIRPPWKAKAT